MRVDDTKNYKRDNPVSMTRRIQNTVFRINLICLNFTNLKKTCKKLLHEKYCILYLDTLHLKKTPLLAKILCP